MISKKIALDVLNACLSTGADFAEIFKFSFAEAFMPKRQNTKEKITTNKTSFCIIHLIKQFT